MDEAIFTIDDDRYQAMQLIAWWSQASISRATIMVVGAGALGNEVLKNLALLGIGRLIIVDHDRIEASNLNRAVLFGESDIGAWKAEVAGRAIAKFHPQGKVETIVGDITTCVGLGLFAESDLVLGCVDNRLARLWINRCCWRVQRPWIDAGLLELSGVIQAFHPHQGACYECGMKEADYQQLALRQNCAGMVEAPLAIGRVPTSPTIAAMMAGLQAQWAIKHLHQQEVPWGQALVFNGQADQFYRSRLPVRQECLSHEHWQVDTWLELDYYDRPLQELFDQLSAIRKGEQASDVIWQLQMERQLWIGWYCGGCQQETMAAEPFPTLTQAASLCPTCQQSRRGIPMMQLDSQSPHAKQSLRELGIPEKDWLRVYGQVEGDQPACLKVIGFRTREEGRTKEPARD